MKKEGEKIVTQSPSGTAQKVRVLLADDHQEILDQLQNLLSPEFDVIGTTNTGRKLIEAARTLRPDVIVTDLRMPDLNGMEAAKQILQSSSCRTIIALTVSKSPQLVKSAIGLGMLGYVLKENAGEQLMYAIRSAMQGRVFISPGIAPCHPE